MKIHPQYIDGKMYLVTEDGDIIENTVVINVGQVCSDATMTFTAQFVIEATPPGKKN